MLNQNRKMNKIIAFVFAAAFLFLMLSFTLYEGTHIIHDCTGEDCTICHELQIAETFTKQILPTVITTAGCFYIAFLATETRKVISSSESERNLIIDKVRIDD